MSSVSVGKGLIKITSSTPGGGGGTTPIGIDGSVVSFSGSTTDGNPITINLVNSNGNLVPNGPVSQTGNTFDAEIVDTTDVDVNSVSQGTIDNWSTIAINVDDKNGNPITPTINKVGNTIGLDIAGTTPFQINSGASPGVVPNWDLFDIQLKDQFGGTIAPTSVSVLGSIITINENVPPAGSGIAFQIAQGTQYTSYANYDEGWRLQNGWFDYVPPLAPLKRAFLDYTTGVNSFYVLGEALIVGGVSSTTRFVDVTGIQSFSGGTNRDKVLIDKLTGLMLYRVYDQGNAIWSTALNNANAFSVTVDGVLYDDWYLISAAEAMAMFGNYRSNNWVDALTGVALTVSWPNGYNHTATTYAEITTQATSYRTHIANGGGMYSNAKTSSYPQIFIRKCRNLIS